ncbi:MAG: NAD-dependent epimerase/dehydratase family protein [Desulfuromonadales bacterium]|nr:NAD-dependent epimerase/dehydratase family protein [Desulfuromonadales bacterium]
MNLSRNDLGVQFGGRKVLVTGGLGFLGQNLVVDLLAHGAEVTILDPAPIEPEFSLADVRLVREDIRQEQLLASLIEGQEVIFNLAGRSGVVASNDDPLGDLEINCRGQLALLEACRRHNPSVRIIFPSTRLVYGKPLSLPVTEKHPLAPESIYAAHKLAGENYHLIFGRLYGPRVTVLRISNPYGPLQAGGRHYGIANVFIQKACRGETITLFGDGRQQRDFLYVRDLCEAMMLAASSERSIGQIYNIGAKSGTSLLELAQLAVATAGRGTIENVPWPAAYDKVETGDYRSDISLARQELGWTPNTSLADGVARTVQAYQQTGLPPAEIPRGGEPSR